MRAVSKRLFFAAEDAMQRSLDVAQQAWCGIAGRRVRSKADLRGHACHCPPGMPMHLVHSEGLREAADVVIDFGTNVPCRERAQVPVRMLQPIAREIGAGDIVHVKTDRLEEFVTHVFPEVRGPIVLVTGDSDFGGVHEYAALLQSDKIVHWFAQSCDVPWRHPKLTRIPIGIDNPIFTKLEKRVGFLVDMACGKSRFDWTLSRNDMGEQHRLQAIAAGICIDPRVKPARALCTFHVNQKLVVNFEDIADRKEAFETLNSNPACHFMPRRLPQDECWKLHASFAFEVSPRGKGVDCFRTWESLYLGCIPIVKTSTLDPLYVDEALPVVIVDSWDEIDEQALARWKAEHAESFTEALRRKLSNDYWVERIRAVQMSYRSRVIARVA